MGQEDGRALDHYLTTPPSTCEEDGHDWMFVGYDEEDRPHHLCRRCKEESE